MRKSLLLLLALAGCASSTDNLRRVTASSVPGNLPPDRIVVADVDRGMTDVHWTAQADGRSYACSADDMVHRAVCVRR